MPEPLREALAGNRAAPRRTPLSTPAQTLLITMAGVTMLLLLACAAQAKGPDAALTLPKVLQQAIARSYELKISKLEEEISEQRLLEARAMYLPTLSLRLTNEYLHDLGNQPAGTVSVGETVIAGGGSTYQHSLSLYAGYQLYDFGARALKYENAGRAVHIARLAGRQELADLKLRVLSLYGQCLKALRNIEAWSLRLAMHSEIYHLAERLHGAGETGRVEVGEAAIAVADTLQTLQSWRLELGRLLQELAYHTGESYEPDRTVLADLQEPLPPATLPDVRNLPEVKALGVTIEQKEAEYRIALRRWLPSLNLYSSYRMYGNDQASFKDSFEAMEERNATIGLVVDWNLFNGFRDHAEAVRLERELARARLERAKRLAEKKRELAILAETSRQHAHNRESWRSFRKRLENQARLAGRLADQQIIDRISWLKLQAGQVEKRLALELADLDRRINTLHLRFLAEAAKEVEP